MICDYFVEDDYSDDGRAETQVIGEVSQWVLVAVQRSC